MMYSTLKSTYYFEIILYTYFSSHFQMSLNFAALIKIISCITQIYANSKKLKLMHIKGICFILKSIGLKFPATLVTEYELKIQSSK
jgi:hypothetical protein